MNRLKAFLFNKTWPERSLTVRSRFKAVWGRGLPGIPLPTRLPYGGWWLAINDYCSDEVFLGRFETLEWKFVDRYLRPGMMALDIGAHHGFYTISASKRVGTAGKVVAFEPSPRERARLERHLRINRCTANTHVVPMALGETHGTVQLYVAGGRETGLNSLRPPVANVSTTTLSIRMDTLDGYLDEHQLGHVDFIKIDVEGAELAVFRGAVKVLSAKPRPVILCEVEDTRTEPYGHRALDVVRFLGELGYQWFALSPDGQLVPVPSTWDRFDHNLVSIPEERVEDIRRTFPVRGFGSEPLPPR